MAYARRAELFLSCILPSSQTVNMTLSPSLLAYGRPLRRSEMVISNHPLCPVKLGQKFVMPVQPWRLYQKSLTSQTYERFKLFCKGLGHFLH